MTTLKKAIEKLYAEANKTNEEANKAFESLEKGIIDLADYARSVGEIRGVNKCLNVLLELLDEETLNESKEILK